MQGMGKLQNLNISVAAGTQLALEWLEECIRKEFYDYVGGPIRNSIENKADEIVISGKNQNLASSDIIKKLGSFISDIDTLINSKDYDYFIDAIYSLDQRNQINMTLSKLKENFNFINLFRQIKDGAFPTQNFTEFNFFIIYQIKSKILAISNPSRSVSIEKERRKRPELLKKILFTTQSKEYYNFCGNRQYQLVDMKNYDYYEVYDNYQRKTIKYTFTLTNGNKIKFYENRAWKIIGTPEEVFKTSGSERQRPIGGDCQTF